MPSSKLPLLLLGTIVLLLDAFLVLYPPGLRSLDARFFYSVADIYSLFDSLRAIGRAQYFKHQLVDLSFLCSYSILIVLLMRRIYQRRQVRFPTWTLGVCLLPGFLDFVETIGILALLMRFPDQSPALANWVRVATPLKWISLFPVLLLFAANLRRRVPVYADRLSMD